MKSKFKPEPRPLKDLQDLVFASPDFGPPDDPPLGLGDYVYLPQSPNPIMCNPKTMGMVVDLSENTVTLSFGTSYAGEAVFRRKHVRRLPPGG